MLCNPVHMSLYLQQEVEQGQRGHPCLFQYDYANFTVALICKGHLNTLISAPRQVECRKAPLLYKMNV